MQEKYQIQGEILQLKQKYLEKWCNANAIVPSGASTGALKLQIRDGDKTDFRKGVPKAVENVNEIIVTRNSRNGCT